MLSISSPYICHPSENTRKSNANLPNKSECRFIVHISCVMLSRAEKRVEVNSGMRRSREVVCGWNTDSEMDLFTIQKRILYPWLQNTFHCRSSSTERWYSIEQQQWSMGKLGKSPRDLKEFFIKPTSRICVEYGWHRICTDKEIEWEIQASQISSDQPSFYCCCVHNVHSWIVRQD